MNVFVYSDESGVFDRRHNDYFLFAGLICFGNKEKEIICRKYSSVENVIRNNMSNTKKDMELKGSKLSNERKLSIFRSLNNVYKFCVLIKQKDLKLEIFENKKHKQRYLDFAYKMVLKKCFDALIKYKYLKAEEVTNIFFNVDEHSTATDGLYELQENLLNKFKNGTFNYSFDHFYNPILPKVESIQVNFCDSSKTTLVRAADIIANRCYYLSLTNNGVIPKTTPNMFIYYMPSSVIASIGHAYFKKMEAQRD